MKTGFTQGGAFETDVCFAPAGWYNYHMNESYLMTANSLGQGESRVLTPAEREIGRGFRGFYLRTEEGCARFPHDFSSYHCRHTLWDSEYRACFGGIWMTLRAFVPCAGTYEVWTVTLENGPDAARTVDLFAAFAPETGGMGPKADYRPELRGIVSYVHPYYIRYEEKERCDRELLHCFLSCTRPADSFDASLARFWGSAAREGIPAAVRRGTCSGLRSDVRDPVAALHHRVVLPAGECHAQSYLFGCAASEEQIRRLCGGSCTEEAVEALHGQVKRYWESWTARLRLDTPDREFSLLLNGWLSKQASAMARGHRYSALSCVRNELQDALGVSFHDAEYAWELVCGVLSGQRSDGYLKQWHMREGLPERGLAQLHHMDGCAWLAVVVPIVLKRTGEAERLEQELPYADGTREIVRMHLLRAVRYLAAQRGAHGLCLFGDGDWNDPINGMGREGKGESVWTTQALCVGIREFLSVLPDGDSLRAELDTLLEDLRLALHRYGFAGDRFLIGYHDSGRAVGTREDAEGACYLNTQTWAVLAGGLSEREKSAVRERTAEMETDAGPRVLTPALTQWHPLLGKLSTKGAGTSENGAVYCHAAMFKAYADCLLGKPDEAWDTVRKILPTNEKNPPEKNGQAPLYVPNYYFGLPESPDFGVSSGNHSTGSLSWMFQVIVEQLLGVEMLRDGLRLRPMLPDAWPSASLWFSYRKSRYHVTFIQADATKLEVDGSPCETEFLPCAAGRTYEVKAYAGRERRARG